MKNRRRNFIKIAGLAGLGLASGCGVFLPWQSQASGLERKNVDSNAGLVFDDPPNDTSGVTYLNMKKASACYRLYSSRHTQMAHLIDACGNEVHQWHYDMRGRVEENTSGFGMTWHYAEMLPNGHLIAIIKDKMMLELDWNSNLVWKVDTRAHHDFQRLQNGNTLVVSRRDIDIPWKSSGKIVSDIIYEYTPEKEIVWKWKAEEHIKELKDHVDLPHPPPEEFNDWPHINTVEMLPQNPIAGKDSRFQSGNILFCGRHINTIWIVDRKTGKVVWAWGPEILRGPHMPTMLPNGHILVYDNGKWTRENPRGYTQIIEINPLTNEIVWKYKAKPQEEFYSPSRGSNELLPNGNVLIAESDSGHLFEITREGEVVWEFYNSDIRDNGERDALYRTVPYPYEIVKKLLSLWEQK